MAAVGMAMLGLWFCLKPADAKREDFNGGKLRVTHSKELKAKVKKRISQISLARRKPLLGGKPVSSQAAKQAVKKRISLASPPSVKAVPAKLPPKRLAASKPKSVPRMKDLAKIAAMDGLPPFVRANRARHERERRTDAAAMIVAMAPCQKVPVWFALRVAMTESSLDPKARGSAGEIGLFQMKCATARYLGFTGDCEGLYDARTNIYWGLKHLSRALQFSDGDARHAASKHNGGLGTRELRPDYVRQVMCGSARSGFPSAYQLGASSDILRMCAASKTRPKTARGLYDKKDLLTSSIAEIGLRTAAMAREGTPAQLAYGCRFPGIERAPTLASRTDAKPQQAPAKQPAILSKISIIGSLSPIYPR